MIDDPGDPIVTEIRAIRKAHAEQFNNDPHLICEDIRRLERESGRTYVAMQPRQTEPEGTPHATTQSATPVSAK